MNAAALDLSRLLGPGAVSAEPSDLDACARDCWPRALGWSDAERLAARPLAVVRPEREEQAARVLEWAFRNGVPVTPRGGGSGVLGAAIPSPGGLVVDCGRLTSLCETRDGASPQVRVSAGWLGGALERRLNAEGRSLRHWPASLEISSVGGWIAGAGSGQLSSRYGAIGAQTLAVRALGPRGEPVDAPVDALVGSEGTLGLITEATLLVRPAPTFRGGWGLGCGSFEEALEAARRCREEGASVVRVYSAVDALLSGLRSRRAAAPGGDHGPARRAVELFLLRRHRALSLLSPLAGSRWLLVAVWEDSEPPAAPAGARVEPALRWRERRFQWDVHKLERLFAAGAFADTLDVWAPYAVLAGVVDAVARAVRPFCFSMAHVSHLDERGACLYVTMAGAGGDRNGSRRLHESAWKAAVEAAVRAGARATHHHGVGLGKRPWLRAAASRTPWPRSSAPAPTERTESNAT